MQYRKGDTVVITDPGKTYSTHETAFTEFGFKHKLSNPQFGKYEEGTVFNTGIVNGGAETVSVRHKDGRECLIGVYGVSLKTNNMDNLTITKEKVLQAAEKCPQAKETLKTLFPEVFEDDKYFNLLKERESLGHTVFSKDGVVIHLSDNACGGKYRNKAFYLTSYCNWELIREDVGFILIPTRKK